VTHGLDTRQQPRYAMGMYDIPRPDPMPDTVVKLVSPSTWRDICETSLVPYSALDLADGFMHLSTKDQMIETANRYYTDYNPTLGLTLAIADLENDLRWEPAAKRNNELFPHLYAPCPRALITAVLILRCDHNAVFSVKASYPPTLSPDTNFTDL